MAKTLFAFMLLLTRATVFAQDDPILEKARQAARTFTGDLPNYFCNQITTRYVGTPRAASWRIWDVISAEVIYEKGAETYRNVTLDGKPVKNTEIEHSGAWSTGEFGSQLVDLFAPSTTAQFHFRRNVSIQGHSAALYDYQVARENSHWGLVVTPRIFYSAQQGSVWIERETGRVLRLERRATNLPKDCPLLRVEISITYEYVRIGGTQRFLLPAHSQFLMCPIGTTSCDQNEIYFRNYRKYTGEASIKFDE